MKKFTAIIAAALAALAITVPVFAENDDSSTSDVSTVTSVSSGTESSDEKVPQNLTYTEYKLSDIGMNIKLPDSMYILTRDMKDDDPSLKACGLKKDEVMKNFKDSDTYIKAIEKNFSYDITVTMVKNSDTETVDNLTSLSNEEIQSVIDNLLNQNLYKGCSKSKFNNTQFLTLDLQYDSSNTKIYGIQEYTVIKGTKVVVTFQSYDGEISDSEKSLLNTIMNSVTFDGIDSAEKVSSAASTSIGNLDIRYIYIIIASVVGIAALAAMIIVLIKYRHSNKTLENNTDKPEKPKTDKSDNAVNIGIKTETMKIEIPKEQPHTETDISQEEKTLDDMFDLQPDNANVIYEDKKEDVQPEKPQENVIPYLESSQSDEVTDETDSESIEVNFINSVIKNEKMPKQKTDSDKEIVEVKETTKTPDKEEIKSETPVVKSETVTQNEKTTDKQENENPSQKSSDETNDEEEIVFAETTPKTHTKIEQISENNKDEPKTDVKPDTEKSDNNNETESDLKTETKDNKADVKAEIKPETTEMSEYEKRFGKNRITSVQTPTVDVNNNTNTVSKFEKYFGKLTPAVAAPVNTEKPEPKAETPVKTEKVEQKVETPVKTEKVEPKTETPVNTEKPEPKAETPVKTEKTEPKAETPVNTEKTEPKAETPVNTEKPKPKTETPVKTEKPEPKAETPVKTEKTEPKAETPVKTEKTEPKAETPVKTEKTEPKTETSVKTEKPEPKAETPVKTEKSKPKTETSVKTEKSEPKAETPVTTEKPKPKTETSVKTEKSEPKAETPVKTEKPEPKAETPVNTEKSEPKAETPVKTEKTEPKAETPVNTEKPEPKTETPVTTEKPEPKTETPVNTEKAEQKAETPVNTEKVEPKAETPIKTENKEVLSMNSQNNVNGNKEENEEQKEGFFAKLKTKLFMENNDDFDYYDIPNESSEKSQQSETVSNNADDENKNSFWQKVKNKLKNNPDEQDEQPINSSETEKAPVAENQTDNQTNVEVKNTDSVQNTLTYAAQQKIGDDNSDNISKYEKMFGANRENKKPAVQTAKKSENNTSDGKQIPSMPVIPSVPTVPVVPVAVPSVKVTKNPDVKVSAEKPETEADFFEGVKPVEEKIVNSTEYIPVPKAAENNQEIQNSPLENTEPEQPAEPEFVFERDTGIVFEHAIPDETPLKMNFTPFTNVPRLESVNADEYNKKMEELKKAPPKPTQSDFEKRFGTGHTPKAMNDTQKNQSVKKNSDDEKIEFYTGYDESEDPFADKKYQTEEMVIKAEKKKHKGKFAKSIEKLFSSDEEDE
ncbi:MAG: hypothetical protein PUG48_01655 [Clostridia bacterium]|nr:hypothetical protein [Clostridia bacterium]